MSTNLRWDEFADAVVKRLVRPKDGEAFLILADTSTDPGLSQACLSAGLRAGADAQLLIYRRMPWGEAVHLGPVVSEAIRTSRVILGLTNSSVRTAATADALANGTRILFTQPWGVEDYLFRGFLDVDYEAMIRNGEIVAEVWNATEECVVVSEAGTDIRFQLAPRKCIVGDGVLTEEGELDFFPGVQVSIAPVESSINGRIVVDASDNIQGVLGDPYALVVENGVIKALEGGLEANKMRTWLETRRDPTIYRLCHFTIGLNPKAGISGNMIEDERLLGAVDFGFGSQAPKFGGTVGSSPFHMDVILASPTIYLDGKVMSDKNKLNEELGFEEV